jgi:hypothetical protein
LIDVIGDVREDLIYPLDSLAAQRDRRRMLERMREVLE